MHHSDIESLLLKHKMRQSLDKLMKLKINKTEKFIPKPDLGYDEFLAIKQEFVQHQFRQQSKELNTFFVAHIALLVVGRLIRKSKLL